MSRPGPDDGATDGSPSTSQDGRKDDGMEDTEDASKAAPEPGAETGAIRRSRAAASAVPSVAAALLALCVAAGPAAGQETEEDRAGPPMADAPNQFRASVTAGLLAWDDPEGSGGKQVDDGALWGLDLETRVSRWVSFRFGGAYGRTTITGPDESGTTQTVDANQVVLELVAEPRLEVGPLRRAGVVPFGILGAGSVVHDPADQEGEFDPSLPSRSQGALIYGGGVEVAPEALGSMGVRLEWRRSEVQLQPTFVVTSLEGSSRGAGRFMGSVYWSF